MVGINIWHVNDLKISHVEKKVIQDIITYLIKFGKESPLTTTHGKVLEYLSMTLDYTTMGKVKICMYEYIDKMLSKLPTDMNGSATMPAAGHLFDVNSEAKKLPEATAQVFHHQVAKLLTYLDVKDRRYKHQWHSYVPEYKPLTNMTTRSSPESPMMYQGNDFNHQARRQCAMVGRQFICSSPGHAE